MRVLDNVSGGDVVIEIANRIVENKAYLSELDGKIGDGDHGVNMAKGFGMAAERLKNSGASFSQSLDLVGDVLLSEIGGSMGPLYGVMFAEFAARTASVEMIDAACFARMLEGGLAEVRAIGSAQVGDKTLLDTFVPAVDAFNSAIAAGKSFDEALDAVSRAAETGRDSTRDLVARIGRAARLGERSRGVLDAGATSCAIILTTMATGVSARLVG